MPALPPQRVPITRNNLVEREWLRFFEEFRSVATESDMTALHARVDAIQAAYAAADAVLQAEIDAIVLEGSTNAAASAAAIRFF